jgi:D-glycero-alpha-D-manno-heptose-7-phosphate kinase
MRTITGRVPVRVDLAGGTIDIWPLHLTLPEPGVTVNAALDLPARVTVTALPGSAVHLASADQRAEARFRDVASMRASLDGHPALGLLGRAVEAVVPEGGVSVTTQATSPQGAGLGGSSALLACTLATLAHAAERPLALEAVRRLAQDVETAIVHGPTGYQDYYPPLFGGCLALEGRPGGVGVERLPVDLGALSHRLRLVYTGVPHRSGITNWGAMRAYFDGEAVTVSALEEIATLSRALRDALRANDLDAALALVVAEGVVRRRMAPGIATPQIDALDAAVRSVGALGTKVMGAGGGGCVLVVLRDEAAPAGLDAALRTAGARPLPCRLVERGLELFAGAEGAAA